MAVPHVVFHETQRYVSIANATMVTARHDMHYVFIVVAIALAGVLA